jgi:RNase E specificity factor CsrD
MRAIAKNLLKDAIKWRSALETAIEHQAFVMLFQPVILASNNEILARMRDNGELVSATVFLPMAKKLGLIIRMDQLVVEKTIKLLQHEKSAQNTCSLNLDINSLLDHVFQQWFLAFLQQYPKVACRIIIEVSECSLVYSGQAIKPFLGVIHKTGVRLLVDQVGLYVHNTRYIREYEIDYLKLHVSIVKNIDQRPEHQLFVTNLQGFAVLLMY